MVFKTAPSLIFRLNKQTEVGSVKWYLQFDLAGISSSIFSPSSSISTGQLISAIFPISTIEGRKPSTRVHHN